MHDLERVMAEDFLTGLESADMDDVRARRQACEEVEVRLSYVRRLVQGRLDIVRAEQRRRDEGGEADLAALVDQLPSILAGPPRPSGPGRLPTRLEPDGSYREVTGELDRIVDAARLAGLTELPDGEVAAIADELQAFERRVSGQRRALHERLDAIQAEIVRRYRSGELSVDTLLP